jgi:RimJ/RimL family protein N-acetyltransferase
MITEQNFIDCRCPHCDAAVSFPQDQAGMVQACPACLDDLIPPEKEGDPARSVPVPITSPRLVLRRLAGGDWKGLMECLETEDEDRILDWLQRDPHVRLTTANQTFYLALELRDGGRLIGYFGLRLSDSRQATITYCLHPEIKQADLMAEALDALLGFCFKGIKLHRVTLRLMSTDELGIKMCEEAGLRREAEFLKDTHDPERGWLTSVSYAILEEEFLARR